MLRFTAVMSMFFQAGTAIVIRRISSVVLSLRTSAQFPGESKQSQSVEFSFACQALREIE